MFKYNYFGQNLKKSIEKLNKNISKHVFIEENC